MKTRFLLLFISLNFIFATSLFADVVYVNAAATPGGDGSSWNTAFTNLYDAIDAAQSGDEIWLAGGEYNTFVRPGDTENSPYIIDKSLSIHGGFVAGQASLQERDTTMPPTVLTSFEGETFYYLFVLNESEAISFTLEGLDLVGANFINTIDTVAFNSIYNINNCSINNVRFSHYPNYPIKISTINSTLNISNTKFDFLYASYVFIECFNLNVSNSQFLGIYESQFYYFIFSRGSISINEVLFENLNSPASIMYGTLGLEIKNSTFVSCRGRLQTGSISNSVTVYDSLNIYMSDININNYSSSELQFTNSQITSSIFIMSSSANANVSNITIENSRSSISSTNDLIISNSNFKSCSDTVGSYISSSEGSITITDSHFEDVIAANSQLIHSYSDISISNSNFTSCSSGAQFILSQTGDGTFTGLNFEDIHASNHLIQVNQNIDIEDTDFKNCSANSIIYSGNGDGKLLRLNFENVTTSGSLIYVTYHLILESSKFISCNSNSLIIYTSSGNGFLSDLYFENVHSTRTTNFIQIQRDFNLSNSKFILCSSRSNFINSSGDSTFFSDLHFENIETSQMIFFTSGLNLSNSKFISCNSTSNFIFGHGNPVNFSNLNFDNIESGNSIINTTSSLTLSNSIFFSSISGSDFIRSTSEGSYSNIHFENNESQGHLVYNSSKVEIINSIFKRNTSNNRSLLHNNQGTFLRNNQFINNTFTSITYGSGSTEIIYNCIIVNNILNKVFEKFPGETFIINSSIVNNYISNSINERRNDNPLIIYNSLFWNNTIFSNSPWGDVNYVPNTFKYSNFDYFTEGEGNLSIDPLFVDPENGDFRLSCNSPLINMGHNDYALPYPDLDGNNRIFAGRVDMGAYESQYNPQFVYLDSLGFDITTLTPCINQEIRFDNRADVSKTMLYKWNFGDGSPVVFDTVVTHSYNSPGQYEVTVEVSNGGCGFERNYSFLVEVRDVRVPQIFYPTSVCPLDNTVFATDITCGNFHWSVSEGGEIVGDSLSPTLNVHWPTDTLGNGKVTLIVTDCEHLVCELPVSATIPIVPVNVKVTGNEIACRSSIEYYNSSLVQRSPATLYRWRVEGGRIQGDSYGYDITEIKVEWEWGSAGLVILETYNEMLECGGIDTLEVELRQRLSLSNTSMCQNNSNVFSISGSNQAFKWGVNNMDSVYADSTRFVWQTSELDEFYIYVWLEETDLYCNLYDSALISVNEEPIVSILGETNILPGRIYDYEILSSVEVIDYTWWNTGGSFVSRLRENASVIWNDEGLASISCRMRFRSSCSDVVTSLEMLREYIYTVSGIDSLCIGSSSVYYTQNHGDAQYTWTLNGVPVVSNDTLAEIRFTSPGFNTVAVNIAHSNGRSYTVSKRVFAETSPNEVRVAGSNFISHIAGGNDIYNLINPNSLPLHIECMGADSYEIVNDTLLSVVWGESSPYIVRVYGEPVGSCPTRTSELSVSRVSPYTDSIFSQSDSLCFFSTVEYSIRKDRFFEGDPEWSLSGGGEIISQSANSNFFFVSIVWGGIAGTYNLSANFNRLGNFTISRNITINNKPYPSINNPHICGDEPVQLSTSTQYNSYLWKNEDNTIVSNSASANVSQSGLYNLIVTDANGCTGFESRYVGQTPYPEAKISHEGRLIHCPGDAIANVKFWTNEALSYSYRWYRDGLLLNNQNGPILNVTVDRNFPGTQTYMLEVGMNGCVTTHSRNITVKDSCSSSPPDTTTPPCTDPSVSYDISGCNPVSFENTSDATDNFIWNFGDGTTSTDITPADKYYTSPGRYKVSLSRGCEKHEKMIDVSAVANFKIESTTCQGSIIRFVDLSEFLPMTPISSWTWNFGDGTELLHVTNRDSARVVSHIFSAAGTYNVQLTVEADGCESSYVMAVTVRSNPIVDFEIERISCTDNLYRFQNTSILNAPSADYIWLHENIQFSENTNANYRFNENTGIKEVSFVVINSYGCTAFKRDFVTLSEPYPILSIAHPTNLQLCGNEKIKLTAPEGFEEYLWLKDGISLELTDSILWITDAGLYSLNYLNNDCEITTNAVEVTRFASDVAVVVPEYVCEGGSVSMSVQNSPSNVSYVWYKNGDIFSNSGSSVYIHNSVIDDSGNYSVQLTDNMTGCTKTFGPYSLTIEPSPSAPSLLVESDAVCHGGSTSITFENDSSIYQLRWLLNGSVYDTVSSSITLNNLTNSASVQLSVTDIRSACVSQSEVTNIVVSAPISVSINLPDTIFVCRAASTEINASLSNSQFDFQWYHNDSLLLANQSRLFVNTAQYTDSGYYHVRAISRGTSGYIAGCGAVSNSVYLHVKNAPERPIIEGPEEFCDGEAVTLVCNTEYSLLWNVGSRDTAITIIEGGNYIVTVTDPETGCNRVASHDVTRNQKPDFTFLPYGVYDRCSNSDVIFIGQDQFRNFQWNISGAPAAGESENLSVHRDGKYTLFAETFEGCTAESDTLRLTYLMCYDSCVVTTIADSGPGSLRDAIECANSRPGRDAIVFSIEPYDVQHTILLDTLLPSITDAVLIDAFTQSGNGIYNVVIDGSQYPQNAFVIAQGGDNTEIKGLLFEGFENSVLVSSNISQTRISDNIFNNNINNPVRLSDFSTNTFLTENRFYSGTTALRIGNNVTGVYSNKNYYDDFDIAINTDGRVNNFYSYFDSVLNIRNNAFVFNSTRNNEILATIFENVSNHALLFNSRVEDSYMQFNRFINIGNAAVSAFSGNYIYGNLFYNTHSAGIYVVQDSVLISQNYYLNNNPSSKAIDLHSTANGNKQAAEFVNYRRTDRGLLLTGTAQPNDIVELYDRKSDIQMQFSYFRTVIADENGNWEYEIPEGVNFNPAETNYYYNTASKNHNTSELSDVFTVGCFECICTVENTNDIGEGSLRAAIDSAHAGACLVIDFDLPEYPADITLNSNLRAIEVPLTINGAGTEQLSITGTATTTAGFTVESFDVNINNLSLRNFTNGIVTNAENGTFSELNISETTNPLVINGDENTVTGSCLNCTEFEGTQTALQINGNNNIIGTQSQPNTITNATVQGILVNGGTENSILYNSISNNARAIVHTASGNESYPTPINLSGSQVELAGTISGTSSVGDLIQIFRSAYYPEQAFEFVTEVLVTEQDWTISIPSQYLSETENRFFTVTATSSTGNTSELSEPIKLGDFPMVCYVTNTNDAGLGSLREAVECVNHGGTLGNSGIIIFDLPLADENVIELSSVLSPITNPYGVVIDAENVPVAITNQSSLAYAFSWQTANVTIGNLSFSNFATALDGASNNTEVSNNSFTSNTTSVQLRGASVSRIANNSFDGGTNAVSISGVGVTIENNQFGENLPISASAIAVDSSTAVSIFDNTISNSGTGIEILNNTNTVDIYNNTINETSGSSIIVNSSTEYTIRANTILVSGANALELEYANMGNVFNNRIGLNAENQVTEISGHGISISGTAEITVQGNILCGVAQTGIHTTNTHDLSISNNSISTDADGNIYPSSSINGIYVDGSAEISNNSIFGSAEYGIYVSENSRLANNTIIGSGLAGVYVAYENVVITQNIFESETGMAIDLHSTANGNKPAAEFINYRRTNSGLMLTGTAMAGDTVELFRNNSTPQQALAYIGTAFANEDGNWEYEISEGENFYPAETNYYVNTATSYSNTSELSGVFTVGCFECICTVENTNDSGEGSLRAAIDSAHAGACLVIDFDLLELPANIILNSNLREIEVPLTINGVGVEQLSILGNGSVITGFTVESFDVNINNLSLRNFTNGIVANAENGTYSRLNITETTNPLVINGDENTLIGSCLNCTEYAGTQTALQINGNNNIIGTQALPNTITNATVQGIVVNEGTENSILYNAISNNTRAIVHTASGNESYPTPINLSGSQVELEGTISGTSNVGDLIQIFRSAYYPEQAFEFVTEMVVTEQDWIISIPSQYLSETENRFFTVTATSSTGNTSELSEPVKIGSYVMICYVTNTNNAGLGSLREAVECVNNAGTLEHSGVIVFDLPLVDENVIELSSVLSAITNPYGVVIDAEDVPVTITNQSSLGYAFSWQTANVTIGNLSFSNFATALDGASNNTEVSNNSFTSNTTSVQLRGASASRVTNNTFDGGTTSISVSGVGVTIENNQFGENIPISASAISVVNATAVNVASNTISNSGTGIAILNGSNTFDINNNIIDETTQNSILVSSSQEYTIRANTILTSAVNAIALVNANMGNIFNNRIGLSAENEVMEIAGNGINVSGSTDIAIQENIFCGVAQSGVNAENTSNLRIINNSISADANGNVYPSSTVNGIYVNGSAIISNNIIYGCSRYGIYAKENSTINENAVRTSGIAGVYVANDNVEISQNIFESESGKAIDLHSSANRNKPAAEFINYRRTNGGLRLTGTSQANDIVEIFRNNSTPQQALAYIGTATANENGNWEYEIAEGPNFKPAERNYYVNTATSYSNTSELSGVFTVGCFECICSVENANDAGESSLRAAIDSAHIGVCLIIDFDLSEYPADITLNSNLREIEVPLTINGAGEEQLSIIGTATAIAGFTVESFDVNINNLSLRNFTNGIVANAENGTYSRMNINETANPIVINGDENTVSGSCLNCTEFEGTQTALQINGNNNIIGTQALPNTITNASVQGVLVNGGVGNSILYNNIHTTGTLISHQADGNNNHPAPSDLGSQMIGADGQIFGNARNGDRVQVFLSQYRREHAYEYVTETFVDGESFTIDISSEHLSDTENTFFILTATSPDGSTSEMSFPIKVGNFPMYCYVRNTDNDGEESLRDAVDCANQAYTNNRLRAVIVFELPEEENVIEVSGSGYEIFNQYGVAIDPASTHVHITTSEELPFAFRWNTPNVSIRNLRISNFETAIDGRNMGARITSNILTNNTTSVRMTGTGQSFISSNKISGTNNAIIIENSGSAGISSNTIDDISGTGILAVNNNRLNISNNNLTNVLAENNELYQGKPLVIVNGEDGSVVSNKVEGEIDTSTAILISDSRGISVRSNYTSNSSVGIDVLRSANINMTGNTAYYVNQSAIRLRESDNCLISQNRTQHLQENAVPISLAYDTEFESNDGKQPPVFTDYTYYDGSLHIFGKAEPYNYLELFESDSASGNMRRYMTQIEVDEFGDFEYSFPINENDVNTKAYRATTNYLYYTQRTSEASDVFLPRLYPCYVTNNTDDAENEGSLRFNINLANDGDCNLIMFHIPEPEQYEIAPEIELPIITARGLTIDGTSLSNYMKDSVQVTISNTGSFDHSLVVDTETNNYIVGLRFDGYREPVRIDNVKYFRNISTVFENYSEQPYFISNPNYTYIQYSNNIYRKPTLALSLDGERMGIEYSLFEVENGNGVSLSGTEIQFNQNTITSSSFNAQSKGLIVDGLIDSAYVVANNISQFETGIDILNSENVNINSNNISSNDSADISGVGMNIRNSENLIFTSNTVRRFATGVDVADSYKIILSQNNVLNSKDFGFFVNNSDSVTIVGSDLNNSTVGIKVIDSENTHLLSNRVYNHQDVGVVLTGNTSGVRFEGNYIGATNPFSTAMSNGMGLVIESSGNTIGGSASTYNHIFNNKKGGVYVKEGTQNIITYNRIFNNDTVVGQPHNFAINHIEGGNNNKSKPFDLDYQQIERNRIYTIIGKAEANDSVHLYFSEGKYQNARVFVGAGVADAQGNWEIEFNKDSVATQYFMPQNVTMTVVATATDTDNNTSELSDILYFGTCFVNNTLDSDDNEYPIPNSLRQSVVCANAQNEYGEIKVAINNYTSKSIGLEIVLPDYVNPHGLQFNGKNIIADREDINLLSADSIGIASAWTLTDTVSNAIIRNLKLQLFDVALDINMASDVELDSLEFYNIISKAVSFGENASDYLIKNSMFRNSPTATYLEFNNSVNNFTIQNCEFSGAASANVVSGVNNILFKNNNYTNCINNLIIEDAHNIRLETNSFNVNQSVSSVGVNWNNSKGRITGNSFSRTTSATGGRPLLIMNNTEDTEIVNNSFYSNINTDNSANVYTTDTTVWISNSDNIRLLRNQIGSAQISAVQLTNSKGILFNDNTISALGTYGISIAESDSILITDNSILDFRNSDVKAINLNKDNDELVSNENKPAPVIDEAIVHRLEDGDCSTDASRYGIFIKGTSEPFDQIELFFSDSLRNTLRDFIVRGEADEFGNWMIRLPRDRQHENLKIWYHISATASDTSHRTSEAAEALHFPQPEYVMIVKNTNNEGPESLRYAIESVNCSDVRARVLFDIPTPAPHEIVLNEPLPQIYAFRGFEIVGASQLDSALARDADLLAGIEEGEIAEEIIVNTQNLEQTDVALFIMGTTFKSEISDISFKGYSGIDIRNRGNKLSKLRFYGAETENGLNAINISNAPKNVIEQSFFTNYDTIIHVKNNSEEVEIKQNNFERSLCGVKIDGNNYKTLVDRNTFGSIQSSFVGVLISNSELQNIVKRNNFGTQNLKIKQAVKIENSRNQLITHNRMINGVSAQPYILVTGNSSGITISYNKIGIDAEGNYNFSSPFPEGIEILGNDDYYIDNCLIEGNQIITGYQTINISRARTISVVDNYLGIDSVRYNLFQDNYDFNLAVSGRVNLSCRNVNSMYINNNVLLSRNSAQIFVREEADYVIMNYNIIASQSNSKGIDFYGNVNDGINAPTITSDQLISIDTLKVSGQSSYPNAYIYFYQANGTYSQSLKYLRTLRTDNNGNWSVELNAHEFGFGRLNSFVAQVRHNNRSSEFSVNYSVEPLLCRLVASGIDLLDDEYTPCPDSDFRLDAQIEGVEYSWTAQNGEFEEINEQIAFMDTSAFVTLTLSDTLGCSHVETFNLNVKEMPQEPEFIIATNNYVDDEIVLIDVAENQADDYYWTSGEGVTITDTAENNNFRGPDGKIYPFGRVVKFMVQDEGDYEIFQTTVLEGCFHEVKKEINVTYKDANEEDPYSFETPVNSITCQNIIEPGSNANAFIDVSNTDRITISIVGSSGSVIHTENLEGRLYYMYEMPVASLTQGSYTLRVTTSTNVISTIFVIGE